MIGVLALMLAAGEGGQATDTHGAVVEVARQPFGSVLLEMLGGLVAYVVYQLCAARYRRIPTPWCGPTRGAAGVTPPR
ncbi:MULTISPECIES: DUF1206 domain-containing protein [unclassified Myxococcus]|uniref:DUF1206 domain-containing protein n=1 Tax=Myxococcus TaxID=32 RepID=UPI001EEFC255|nr:MULTISPECIES: DUF1206 domain-containing protein [unclassified Myxococcus]